jgi:PAS domain S-box-containing protein
MDVQTALHQSQAQLVDIAYAAMLVRDATGHILFWNREAEQLYGWTRAEALGQVVHELLATQFPQPLAEIEAAVYTTGRWQGELVHTRRDGQQVYVQSRWARQSSAGNAKGDSAVDVPETPDYILEVNMDVTEQRHTQAAWAASEERFHAAIENMLDGFAILSPVRDDARRIVDFTYVYRNRAAVEPDLPSAQIQIGQRMLDLRPDLRESDLFDAYCRVIETGAPLLKYSLTDTDLRSEPPQTRAYNVQATRLDDDLAVSWRDITATKQAEEEAAALIREQAARSEAEAGRARFAFLAEASGVLASSLDYQTTLASVARLAAPGIADWCSIDVVADDGSIQLLAVAHVDAEKVQWAYDLRRRYPVNPDAPTGLAHVLRTGQSELYPNISDEMLAAWSRTDEQLAISRRVGFRSLMLVPLTAHGRTLGAITMVSAESDRHFGEVDLDLAENLARHAASALENARLYREVQELNESLKRRAATLETANKELEAFAYSVSHDLRSPLRAIDGFSRILIEEHQTELDDEGRRYLSFVRDNAQKMGELIDDLLAFSRLGRAAMQKQMIDMKALAQRVVEDLYAETEGRDVAIVIGDLPSCRGDIALLKQVFANLLTNALKFTRRCQGARIEVGTQTQNGETVYFVRDNGVGFDMKYAHKLFGVFQRLHRAEDYEGTGAGLAIVQRIIHRHGGRVWAEGEEGKGATFYFTL